MLCERLRWFVDARPRDCGRGNRGLSHPTPRLLRDRSRGVFVLSQHGSPDGKETLLTITRPVHLRRRCAIGAGRQLAAMARSRRRRHEPRKRSAHRLEQRDGHPLASSAARVGQQHAGHLGKQHVLDRSRQQRQAAAVEDRQEDGRNPVDPRGWRGCLPSPFAGREIGRHAAASVLREVAQLCQPFAADRRPAGGRAFWQRRAGGLRFRRQPALASQPAEGLRRLYDLVGPRQQPRALRRSGDLALHSRLVRRLAGQALAELRGRP